MYSEDVDPLIVSVPYGLSSIALLCSYTLPEVELRTKDNKIGSDCVSTCGKLIVMLAEEASRMYVAGAYGALKELLFCSTLSNPVFILFSEITVSINLVPLVNPTRLLLLLEETTLCLTS